MGLSREVINDPKDLTAEQTVRLFYYYWDKEEYKKTLPLIDKKSDFYEQMLGDWKLSEDDKRRAGGGVRIVSIKREYEEGDDQIKYGVEWNTDSGSDRTLIYLDYFYLTKIDDHWKIVESTLGD